MVRATGGLADTVTDTNPETLAAGTATGFRFAAHSAGALLDTVRRAVEDWLREGLDGTSDRTRTLYEGLLGPLLDVIGARPLRVLSAGDVRAGLGKLAERYSTRSLQITRNSLERAIRHAESNDLVLRNVAALVKVPQGRSGRLPRWWHHYRSARWLLEIPAG